MKILHKYVLKEHLGPFVFAMTALTSLLLLQYIAKRFGELVGKGLPWSVIGEFLVLSLPLTIALSLPMAVLVATLYAFSRLASDNEITALKASGVSMRTLMVPAVAAGGVVTVLMLLFNDQVLPRSNHRLRTLQGDIAQKKPTFALREQVINEVSPSRLYLRAARISQSTNAMRDVVIYDVGDLSRRRTIYADSGTMALSADQSDLHLTLYSGTVHEVPVLTPAQLQRLYFETEVIRVRGVGNEFQKSQGTEFRGEREMSICEMEDHARVSRNHFSEARRDLLEKVALAERRGVELSQEIRSARTELASNLGIGAAYCWLLRQARVKPLIAQEAPPPGPTRALLPGSTGAPSAIVQDSIERMNVPNEAIPGQAESARLRLVDAVRSVSRYEVEIHKKFALASACLIFVLLGAPVALRFPRSGVGLTIAVSLGVFGLYYVGLIAGESLARRGHVPAFVSMWIANAVFGSIALILLARMGREAGSNRGGDLRDVFAGWNRSLRRKVPGAGRRVGGTRPR